MKQTTRAVPHAWVHLSQTNTTECAKFFTLRFLVLEFHVSHETNQRSPGRGYGLCMSVIEQICCVQRQGKLLAMVMSQAEILRKPVSQPILMESVQKVLPVEAEHMLRIPCRLHQNELMHCGNTTWKYIFLGLVDSCYISCRAGWKAFGNHWGRLCLEALWGHTKKLVILYCIVIVEKYNMSVLWCFVLLQCSQQPHWADWNEMAEREENSAARNTMSTGNVTVWRKLD